MATVLSDLRYAFRKLRKSPGFALAVVVSLGLGIGANSAIFSLLNVLLLRPITSYQPERLVRIGGADRRGYIDPLPGPMFDWLRKEPLLEGVCGVNTPLSTVEVSGTPMPASGLALSGDCYRVFGIRPALGRLFTLEDDTSTSARVTVISYSFWQKQFGGDSSAIGRIINIDGSPFSIIGVTEPSFQGFMLGFPAVVSFPITQQVSPTRNDPLLPQTFYWGYAFARLKPSATMKQVQARLGVEWRRLLEQSLPATVQGAERAENLNAPLAVTPGSTGLDFTLRDRFRRPLLALLGISALVLLVSCINVANLLLARGLQRRREITVRLTLGARRWQIVRELLTECAVLIAGALVFGALLAEAASRGLIVVYGSGYEGFELTAGPDGRVWFFTAAAGFAVLVFFAVLPARQASKADLIETLKIGSRSAAGVPCHTRKVLVCGQVAFTLTLVMTASLFSESLRQLRNQPLGFRVAGMLHAQLIPLPGGYAHGFNAAAYRRDLLERMQTIPGVEAASYASFAPLWTKPFEEEVKLTRTPGEAAAHCSAERVSDGFLTMMGVSLRQGRDFDPSASPEAQRTAIVSESLARRLFPKGLALGQHISVGTEKETQDVEIVGVAANARWMDLRTANTDFVYLNYWQYPEYQLWSVLQLKFLGIPGAVESAARQRLQQAGHEFTLRFHTMTEDREFSLIRERLLADLAAAFGGLALLLAGVGLFGLLGFLVASRTNEIGIRMALGADRRDVSWVVTRETLLLVGTGLLIGLPLSYAAARGVSALLYGVGRFPWFSAVTAVALLLAVSAAASAIPMRRAVAVDPMVALRYE